MKSIFTTVFICSVLLSFKGFAQQKTPLFTEEMKQEMAAKVRAAASHAWEGYKKYAAGYDELKPLTKTARNWYKHSMLMTPVDAYDTFVLLGLTKEAAEAKEMILTKLNFDTDNEVQVFEITIRQLGALVSAYQSTGEEKFITLAKDLADRLMPAFKTPTGMPYRYVHLQTGKLRDSINNPAEIGTLMMEFGQLSKITKDKKYYNAAKKAIMAVYNKRSRIDLVGEQINVLTGKWEKENSHISGYIDSYYEYLYKAGLLFNDIDLQRAFIKHNAAIKKYLLVKTENGTFMQHVNMNTGKPTETLYGALDAFYAGLCAYAGDTVTAAAIQNANYYMWTFFNMEPEEFDFISNKVTAPYYVLRPENLESAWYLFHITERQEYLWQGKTMVDDLIKNCRTDEAFASIKNVQTLEKYNDMESFFFAETLKYAYLLFAPQNTVDLKTTVFNTEAHAFKIIKN